MSPFGPGGYFLPPPTTAFTPGGEISADPAEELPRVLVTGSRYLTNPGPVRTLLFRAWDDLGRPFIVVHGAWTDRATGLLCGADRWADEWAVEHELAGIQVERHRADWKRHGRAGGPLRNAHMVNLGAWRCIAVPIGESRGTRGCMALAEAAGIPVVTPEDVAA